MESILTRFKDIITANINLVLNDNENSMAEITTCINDLEGNLEKIKEEVKYLIEEEESLKREIEEHAKDIVKLQAYAEKSLALGKEADSLVFLSSKRELSKKVVSIQANYEAVIVNQAKMKLMKTKIEKDLMQLNSKRDELISRH